MNNNIDLLSQFEQLETSVANIAIIISAFYTKLIENGVPENLAFQLVIDYNISVWKSLNNASAKGNEND